MNYISIKRILKIFYLNKQTNHRVSPQSQCGYGSETAPGVVMPSSARSCYQEVSPPHGLEPIRKCPLPTGCSPSAKHQEGCLLLGKPMSFDFYSSEAALFSCIGCVETQRRLGWGGVMPELGQGLLTPHQGAEPWLPCCGRVT